MIKFNVDPRSLSEKNRHILERGKIPGIVYGPGISNYPIMTSRRELERVMNVSGQVYEMDIDQKKIYVRLGKVQRDPVTYRPIHFDLIQMSKEKKNEVTIPIHFSGISQAEKRGGSFIVVHDHVVVKGRIEQIPEDFKIEVSNLDIGDKVTVDDLNIPNGLEIKDIPSNILGVCIPATKMIHTEIVQDNLVSG